MPRTHTPLDTAVLKIRMKIDELDVTETSPEVRAQLDIAWWALANAYALARGRDIKGVGLPLKDIKLT